MRLPRLLREARALQKATTQVVAIDAAYKGGSITRLTRDWQPKHRSGDSAIRENSDLLLRRVRDLFRNEPTIKGACRSLAKYCVGPGIQTFASAMLDRENLDDEWNVESDDEFERWSDDEADVEGRMSWPEMQWAHFKAIAETGESLLLKCSKNTPGRSIPLCYQLLETEQLDWTKDWPAGEGRPKTVRGIEYAANNEASAYWIYTNHPFDTWGYGAASNSVRIPADRIIHSYLVERPSQHRGVTWFGASIQSTRDIDWYLGNEMTAAALGALLTLIVKRKQGQGSGLGLLGTSGSTGDEDENGNRNVRLGAGIVADLGSEDSVEVAESNRPNRDAAPFLKFLMMLQGMGIGMSYLRMTGDYSQASYTSARGAHLDDQAYFIVLQSWFGRSVVRPVRREHTTAAAAYGLYDGLTAQKYLKQQRRYSSFDLQPPGREQLDPERETDAALKRIDGNLSTWKDECGLRGKNWRRVAIQLARERAFFKKLGIEPDLQTSTGPTAINTPTKTSTAKSEAKALLEEADHG
jgi:lambda family phage portal protein